MYQLYTFTAPLHYEQNGHTHHRELLHASRADNLTQLMLTAAWQQVDPWEVSI